MRHTDRFSGRAEAYVAGRPSYPDAAIDVLFAGLGDAQDVVAVDLGAGTGISTRLLAARGAHVIAIEPNAAMRSAARPAERTRWFGGTAEATNLETGGADLVVAFQAFHWFDAEPTLREIERILRPGGRAAIVSNERDERDAFTAAYGDLVRAYATDTTERRRLETLDTFSSYGGWRTVRRTEFPSAQELDRATLHARAESTSYLPQSGPDAQRLHHDIDALFESRAQGATLRLALRTIVVAAERAGGGV